VKNKYSSRSQDQRMFAMLSRLVSRPTFSSLDLEGLRRRLGLEGCKSQSQACGLETLDTPTVWFSFRNSIC